MHKKLLLRLSISLGLVCSSTNAIAQAITDDLVSYHRLEKNYKDTSGSTNSHHGTVNKAPAFKGAGAIGHCVEFRDQSSPNMSINLGDHADFDFGSNQDFTISIWFNRLGKMENNNDLGGGSTDATLISDKNWASGGNIGWGIFAASDGGVKFNISNGSTRRDKTIAAGFGSGGVADGQWHHLVVSVDRSGNAKFYIDGKAKGTLSLPSGNIHTGLPVVIGADGERNYPWGGKIDEVAIWRRAITAAEAKTIYDNREKGQAINGKTIVDNDNDGMDDDWEMSTFGALHHTADGDADNDGRANFLEYAQGTNANEASGTSIEISKVMHNNVEYPLISYTRPLLSSAASFHLERTTNFTLWEGGDQQFIAHGTPQDMGAGIKKYSYRYHEPTTTTDKFFRLRVAKSFPEAQSDKVNPTIEFRAGSAFIRWTTKEPTPTILEYGRAGQLVSRYENYTLKTSHEVEIENVQHGETIVYRVIHLKDGQETVSATMESNTVWDYSPPAIPDQGGYVTPGGWANTANTILSLPDAPQKGYCLDYGCGDGKLAYELVRQSDLVILAIEDTQAEVDAARAFLTARGVYGSRVTVVLASNLADTPALEDTYNLVVSQQQIANSTSYNTLKTNTSDYAIQEHGMIAGKDSTIIRGEFKAAKAGIDVWKNQYGNTDNSGSNEDELGNKSSFNDFELKWIGRPGAEIVIDRMVRAPSPLSAGGVFYCQGMGRILALDAHNGSVLWTRDIRDVRRLNMIRDSSNMTATDDGLLMAVKDECWQLDKYTGKRSAVSVIDGPRNDFEYYWGFVANEGGHLLGSAVKKGSFYKDYWGQTYWYDAQSGGETYQVCSDNLFAMNPTNGQQAWKYERGLILNITITIADGKVFFLECTNAAAISADLRNLPAATWKQNLKMVCLDLNTGIVLWDKSISPNGGEPAIWLQHSAGKLVLTGSEHSDDTYYIATFDAATGNPSWSASHSWKSSHHGGNHQHPVIQGGSIFLEPHKYSLANGARSSNVMPGRNGCSTFLGSKNTLMYRGGGMSGQYAGNISMWPSAGGAASKISRVRPSCWLSWIPANGMVLVHEQGAGCSCGSWLETSFGLTPKN